MILDHYIAIFVLPFLLLLYVVRKNRKARRLPPGPWQLPLLGYLLWIDAEKPHETLTRLSRVYGPVCGFRMGSVYTVLLSDPQLIRQSFAKDSITNRAPLYLTHGIMKGYGKYFPFSSFHPSIFTHFSSPPGIICAEGEQWKDQRKFISNCLRNFGMVKHEGAKRDKMEERISDAVNECVSVGSIIYNNNNLSLLNNHWME